MKQIRKSERLVARIHDYYEMLKKLHSGEEKGFTCPGSNKK